MFAILPTSLTAKLLAATKRAHDKVTLATTRVCTKVSQGASHVLNSVERVHLDAQERDRRAQYNEEQKLRRQLIAIGVVSDVQKLGVQVHELEIRNQRLVQLLILACFALLAHILLTH